MKTGKTFIISIAGPSCAGKTETSKAVARKLDAQILSLDSYYIDLGHLTLEERKKVNFDEPASLDHELLLSQLQQLTSGKTIHAPAYDFAQYTRTNERMMVHPAPFIILEGLFLLHWPEVREISDLTVYVDAPDDLCLERREYRDVRERGRTLESVSRRYVETVRPMAAKYVWPTKQFADLVVSGTEALETVAARVIQEANRKIEEILTNGIAAV